MKTKAQLAALFCAVGALFACAEEPPPPSVDEFLNNNVLPDATMVRCGANRASTKYEAECVNAREAINRIAKAEEDERRAEHEAQSERKRRALRRTQEAAAEARRRAAEAARQREEAAYLAQFGEYPGGEPASAETPDAHPATTSENPATVPPADPVTTPTPPPAGHEVVEAPPANGSDLQSIRDELKRRQDGSQ